MCSAIKQVHITRRIIALQEVPWITDGEMLYQKMNSTIDSKMSKWRFIFYFDCFEDKHIDFLLQSVF